MNKDNPSKRKNFSGAQEYFLIETEDRFELEQEKITDPVKEKRIKFREAVLNQFVFRVSNAHCKIQLVWDALEEHDTRKLELQSPKVTLEAQILTDVIESNLLEMAETINQLYVALNSTIHAQFGHLFRRIGKDTLKLNLSEHLQQEYFIARSFLFPELKQEQANVTCEAFTHLSKKLEENSQKLQAFRDKVIAHKNDPDRFNTNLTYQEYSDIFNVTVKTLDAISVVATLKPNNWDYLNDFNKQSTRTKNWIYKGLFDSLKSITGT